MLPVHHPLFNTNFRTESRIWSWGYNSYGYLGDNSLTTRSSPVSVGTSSWSQISSARGHTLAIRSDGSLWAWGDGEYGALGTNDGVSYISIAVSRSTSVLVRSDGGMFFSGDCSQWLDRQDLGEVSTSRFEQIGASSWTFVTCTNSYPSFAALRTDGALFTWGYNGNGQLGFGDRTLRSSPVQVGTSSWTQVGLGEFTGGWMAAIRKDGALFTCGENNDGQLGDGSTKNRSTLAIVGSSSWTQVSCGLDHTLAIRSDGRLFAWGANDSGQLGFVVSGGANTSPIGIGTSSWTQVSAGKQMSMAIRSDGALFTWGSNAGGVLGNNVPTGTYDSPVQIGTSSWTMVFTQHGYSIYGTPAAAIRSDGSLFIWGANHSGSNQSPLGVIGDGSTIFRSSPVQIGTSSWVTVGVNLYALASRVDGALFGWGMNWENDVNGFPHWFNAVGFGDTVARSSPVFLPTRQPSKISPVQIGSSSWTQVSTGFDHSIAIRSGGTLFGWGDNRSGQLGDGTTVSKYSPVALGTSSWTQVAAGGSHSLAIRSGGTLFSWGSNDQGQQGAGSTTNRNSPVAVGSSSWTQIAAGANHSLAIRSGGTLFAWGANSGGQLGDASWTNRSSPVSIGTSSWTQISAYRHSLALRTDGSLYSWGANNYSQTGASPDNSWTSLASNSSGFGRLPGVVFGTRSDGSLWTWGDNIYGGLGQNLDGATLEYLASPTLIGSSSWSQVSSETTEGVVHAIRSDGALFGWGQNQYGTIGDGSTKAKSSPVVIGTSSWTQVSSGPTPAAIRKDGAQFAWGRNINGTVGDGTTTDRNSPVVIGTSSWTQVATGSFNRCAIRIDGGLFVCGNNYAGQLGQGDTTNRSSLIQIGTSSWTQVAVGYDCVLAIRSDGGLFTWGNNFWGELGSNNTTNRSSPVQVGTSSWTMVWAGYNFSAAQRSDGRLFVWGRNTSGVLGQGDFVPRSSPVAIGTGTWGGIAALNSHCMAVVSSDNSLYIWGFSDSGALGNNVYTEPGFRLSPVQVISAYADVKSPTQLGTLPWKKVAAGLVHSLAIRVDGRLFAWGENNYGQLGDGTTTDRTSPVLLGGANVRWGSVSAGENNSQAQRLIN